MAYTPYQGMGPPGGFPPPQPPYGDYGGYPPIPAPSVGRPSVGACIDMVNALSVEERQQFFGLLNVVPRDDMGQTTVPPGYTRDPSSGRVYRLNAPREHSAARVQLEAAVKTAAAALKRHSDTYGITVTGEGDQREVNFPTTVSEAVRAENARQQVVLVTAKEALRAYKETHPGEFTAPVRGRGRGRGNRGRGAPAAPASGTVSVPSRGQTSRGRGIR